MERYFTADLHLGHRNIISYCDRPFRDVDDMNAGLVERWNDTVRPGDEVIVLGDLVAGLRADDARVGRWWEAHDVAQKAHGVKRYAHPRVGELTLHFEALVLADDGDQILTLYAAEPGTRDADRLALLAERSRASDGAPATAEP